MNSKTNTKNNFFIFYVKTQRAFIWRVFFHRYETPTESTEIKPIPNNNKMNLKKCTNHECPNYGKKEMYTLKKTCPECGEKTSEAHYKFINVKGKLERLKEKKRIAKSTLDDPCY